MRNLKHEFIERCKQIQRLEESLAIERSRADALQKQVEKEHAEVLRLQKLNDKAWETVEQAKRETVELAAKELCPLCNYGIMLKSFSGPATQGWTAANLYYHDAGSGAPSNLSGPCKAAEFRKRSEAK